MSRKKSLSRQALKRLPVYMSFLKTIDLGETEYISSSAVAKALDMNDVQVRKDLAAVCKSAGIPKKGFAIRDLISGISDFLGYSSGKDAILIGAGNLGMALMSYRGFDNYGINIVAAFDNRTEVVDNKRIYHISRIKEMCEKLNVKIGIITVPEFAAQKVCDILVDSGILAIWNFAPTHLKAPDDILVQNENMASSLALLSNHLREKMAGE
ncbi:MAG: redox-sensing transcriptional repressor Rex [Ruminococcaceae bacterium]|nr:redox-sensing transcriptional repressor Rex [Oscillospiraceae bacterium]